MSRGNATPQKRGQSLHLRRTQSVHLRRTQKGPCNSAQRLYLTDFRKVRTESSARRQNGPGISASRTTNSGPVQGTTVFLRKFREMSFKSRPLQRPGRAALPPTPARLTDPSTKTFAHEIQKPPRRTTGRHPPKVSPPQRLSQMKSWKSLNLPDACSTKTFPKEIRKVQEKATTPRGAWSLGAML